MMALQPTDSLTMADSLLQVAGDISPAMAGDSAVWDAVAVAGQVAEDTMSAADAVYGAASTLAVPDAAVQAAADAAPLTGNPYYDLAVLACFLAFCLLIYFYRGYAFGIFNVFRGGATTEKILGEQSKVFGGFLVRIISLGLLIAGLGILKFGDIFFAGHLPVLSGWQAAATISGAWGAAALIWGYQYVFLKVAGSLTLSQGFVARLFYLKKIVMAIATVTVLPVFLLFALADGQSARILGGVVIAMAVLLTVFLIIRTFMLFVRQNFSILLWFLYLCAVEIFPLSLAAVVAWKTLG